jgi:hypothetical protein
MKKYPTSLHPDDAWVAASDATAAGEQSGTSADVANYLARWIASHGEVARLFVAEHPGAIR